MQTYEDLLEENRTLKEQIAELLVRVADLEARIGLNSRNSSPARCAEEGILISDRWSAYNFIDSARRQLCWAHLFRDFEWIAEFGAEELGKA
jgi:hypothetical protein